MSAIRFARSTERSLRRQLERSRLAAQRRSDTLRSDASESLALLDLSDLVDGEANDPSTIHHGEALALAVANDHALAEIDAALARLDDGSYGTCERCAAAVPIARLRAIPETRWCVTCSQQVGDGARVLELVRS